MSDGDRVRIEAAQFDDGVYERCGTFGCILANKHAGVHLCPPPPPRRGRGGDATMAAAEAGEPKRARMA